MTVVSHYVSLAEPVQIKGTTVFQEIAFGSISAEPGRICFWGKSQDVIWPRVVGINLVRCPNQAFRWWSNTRYVVLMMATTLALTIWGEAPPYTWRSPIPYLMLIFFSAVYVLSAVIPKYWVELIYVDEIGEAQRVYLSSVEWPSSPYPRPTTKKMFRRLQTVIMPFMTEIRAGSPEE